MSCIQPAAIFAVTISHVVIQLTTNSKIDPLLGATSVGHDVIIHVVPEIVISVSVNVDVFITSLNIT
jgi:hypothetical protein